MGVRLNGRTIGVVQVPDGSSQREVMRIVCQWTRGSYGLSRPQET